MAPLQVRDEKKRRRICEVAAALFAARSFESVRLDEVAARAGVGKGTLYTYYASKEELYLAVVSDGFAALLKRLKQQMGLPAGPAKRAAAPHGKSKAHSNAALVAESPPGYASRHPREDLAILINAMLGYAYRHPHLFTLMRNLPPPNSQSPMMTMRRELEELIEAVIRRGVAAGHWQDAHPAWTAQYLPGMIRSVLLYGGKRPRREMLAAHLVQLLTAGLAGATR